MIRIPDSLRHAAPLAATMLLLTLAACAPMDSDAVSADAPPSASGGTMTDEMPPATPPPARRHTPTLPADDAMAKQCDAAGAQSAIGKAADSATVDQVVRDSGSANARVIKPGMAVTMDYRPDRVNIDVDDDNVIVTVRCG